MTSANVGARALNGACYSANVQIRATPHSNRERDADGSMAI